eukprot:1880312-Pleurochrysis_carterae.AAC.2
MRLSEVAALVEGDAVEQVKVALERERLAARRVRVPASAARARNVQAPTASTERGGACEGRDGSLTEADDEGCAQGGLAVLVVQVLQKDPVGPVSAQHALSHLRSCNCAQTELGLLTLAPVGNAEKGEREVVQRRGDGLGACMLRENKVRVKLRVDWKRCCA